MKLSDREIIVCGAVRETALRVGIKDPAYFSVDELQEMVKQKNPQVSERLESFIKIYEELFNFYRSIEEMGKQGDLDIDETEKLIELVETKNQAREQLLAVLPPVV